MSAKPARGTSSPVLPGLEGLAEQGSLDHLRDTPAVAPVPIPPLDLSLARLLPVLPPLQGDAETVAMGTILRAGCLRDVLVLTLDCWERASVEDREGEDCARNLMIKWREWVGALVVPAEAAWWVEHGRGGAGGVIHAALAYAKEGR